MPDNLSRFEALVRKASSLTEAPSAIAFGSHPFESWNIHPKLPQKCQSLFDDGHCSEATFEALKYLDKTVQKLAKLPSSGKGLMLSAFGGNSPPLPLNALSSTSQIDEQEGYKFIFSGVMSAIRNPKGHEYGINDDPDTCLQYLSLISLLLRKLEGGGYVLPT